MSQEPTKTPLDEVGVGLGQDLLTLLRATGSVPSRITPVTDLPSPVLERATFRIELADGRVLKGRRFDQPSHADSLVRLTGLLGLECLSRVVGREGAATLEEWVPGPTVESSLPAPDLLEACGAILGQIHARPAPPSDVASAPSVATRRALAEEQVAKLERLGLVSPRLGRELRELVATEAPATATAGFIHRDFAPGNLVLGPAGRPVAVDNTTLGIDLHDFDLGRTWYRWPMTAEEWTTFVAGYRRERSPAAFRAHFRFWAAVALVDAALFRHKARMEGVEIPMARLVALVRTRKAGPGMGAA
jgi:hypothetical protein